MSKLKPVGPPICTKIFQHMGGREPLIFSVKLCLSKSTLVVQVAEGENRALNVSYSIAKRPENNPLETVTHMIGKDVRSYLRRNNIYSYT